MRKTVNIAPLNEEIIRPYIGIDSFSGILGEAQVFLSSRNSWSDLNVFSLGRVEYEQLRAKIQIDLSKSEMITRIKQALKATSLEIEQVSLVIKIKCLASKKFQVVINQNLTSLVGSVKEVTLLPSSEIPGFYGRDLQIEIFLTLNENIKNNFPYPNLKSTWLDQKVIIIKSSQEDTFGFQWNSLTQTDREELKLHNDSLVHVVHRLSLIESDNFQDAVDVWVDENYLNSLKSSGSKRNSKFLQRLLVKDVLVLALKNTFDKMSQENNGEVTPWPEVEERPVIKQIFTALEKRTNALNVKISAEKIYLDMFENPDLINEYIEDLFELKKISSFLASESGGE
jgi:hypothetical protein